MFSSLWRTKLAHAFGAVAQIVGLSGCLIGAQLGVHAAPRQFLYSAPKSEVAPPSDGGKANRLQVGPIIGTPQSGKVDRWSEKLERRREEEEKNKPNEKGGWMRNESGEPAEEKEEEQSAANLINSVHEQMQNMQSTLMPADVGAGNNATDDGVHTVPQNNYSRLRSIKENIQNEMKGDDPTEGVAKSQTGAGWKNSTKSDTQKELGRAKERTVAKTSKAFSGDPFQGFSKEELQKKIAKYNMALARESKREKLEQKEIEVDQASSALFTKQNDFNDIERQGDTIIIYRMNAKQKKVAELALPPVPQRTRPVWNFQLTPPNISQKSYSLNNAHLSPVLFQYEIDKLAFKAAGNKNEISNLVALAHKITDINMQDKFGNTLLISSVSNANYDAASFLIRGGADIDMANDFGVTPTHLAVYSQDYNMLEILLDKSPDMGAFDSNGITPLMYAVILGDRYIIQALVENGANALLQNKNGMSALSVAKEYNDPDIISYLEQNSMNAFDATGRTIAPVGRRDSNIINFEHNK